jgi:hypothetical protein
MIKSDLDNIRTLSKNVHFYSKDNYDKLRLSKVNLTKRRSRRADSNNI